MKARKTRTGHKDIEDRVHLYVNAEERAHKIVERLALEDAVDESEVNELINAITPEHYSDVVEERAISKHCGYIVCENLLKKIPKQKYHISIKTNRVYDITERKHFCSSFCFKASKWLEQQIPETPLVSRNEMITVDLLKTSEVREANSSPRTKEDVVIGGKESTEFDATYHEIDMTEEEESAESSMNVTTTQRLTKTPIDAVKDTLLEWFTDQTAAFVKQRLGTNADESGIGQESVENKDKDFEKMKPKLIKSYPHVRNIRQETDQLADDVLKLTIHEKTEAEMQASNKVVLPPLDHKAQEVIRRKIVGERLRRSFGRVLPSFGLQLSDLNSDLMQLIKSFSFSSRNILLSLMEWRLMTLTLLQLISNFTPPLHKAVQENHECYNRLLLDLETDAQAVENVTLAFLEKCIEPENETGNEDYEELD